MRQDCENRRLAQFLVLREVTGQILQKIEVRLPGRIPGVQHEQDDIGLASRVLGHAHRSFARPLRAITFGIEKLKASGDAGRLQLVSLQVSGRRQNIRDRLLVSQKSVDQARFARVRLTDQGERHRTHVVGRVSRGVFAGSMGPIRLLQLAIALRTYLQSTAVQVDEILSQPVNVGGEEPENDIILQKLPGSGEARLRRGIANRRGERRENAGDDPGDVARDRIPIRHLFESPQIVHGQQMASGQIFVDHLSKIVGGQFDHRENLRQGKRSDRITGSRVIESRHFQRHLLSGFNVGGKREELIRLHAGDLFGLSFDQMPCLAILFGPMRRRLEIDGQQALLLLPSPTQNVRQRQTTGQEPPSPKAPPGRPKMIHPQRH